MSGRNSKQITVGGFGHVAALTIGGDHPVVIQTMWKDRLSFADIEGKRGEETAARIRRLGEMGCGLLRFAVPDLSDVEALGRLAESVSMPLCADIHNHYTIALRCLDFPIAKLRLNPGNIGGRDKVIKVLEKAAKRNVPIRIGVNAGSLPLALRPRLECGETSRAEALVQAAFDELSVFEETGFDAVLVSMKASGIADTIKVNRLFRERSSVPLHIGVTEAGPLAAGIVKNTAALLPLLGEGIGDTIRVSLSDTSENEVIAGREILSAVADLAENAGKTGQKTRPGAALVSCPLCGRNGFDTHAFTARWMSRIYALEKKCTIAVMGCAVNGPGEAKHADLGITGVGNKVMIFRHGEVVRTIDADDADRVFEEEFRKL